MSLLMQFAKRTELCVVEALTRSSFATSLCAVTLCAAWPLMSNAETGWNRQPERDPFVSVRSAPADSTTAPCDKAGPVGTLFSRFKSGAAESTNSDVAANAVYNRLKVGTLVEFDKRTRSVGEAVNGLLSPVRYQLTNRTVDSAVAGNVLRRPVPPAAMDAGVMSIEAALLLLIGEENRLVVDHRNRLVAIERMPPGASTPVAALAPKTLAMVTPTPLPTPQPTALPAPVKRTNKSSADATRP
jgi:hypothetical protein